MAGSRELEGENKGKRNARETGVETFRERNLRRIDPAALLADNPAALIVNEETYKGLERQFTPGRFDYPHVARVQIFNADGIPEIKLLIVDGNNRTKYVADHYDQIRASYPDFEFMVNDVTDDILRNPMGKKQEETALTLVQYLEAVIPPTNAQGIIAPDRMAAHFINGWRNMVGDPIADRYSAVAALEFLANGNVNTSSNSGLQKDLERKEMLMSGETAEDRARLQDGLIGLAHVVRVSGIDKKRITQAAFELIASDSEVIGGDRQSVRQVYGMLHTDAVEAKLRSEFEDESQREQARALLGEELVAFYRRHRDRRDFNEAVRTLNSALRDQAIGLGNLNTIMVSDNPETIYNNVKGEINVGVLTQRYLEALRSRGLNQAELQLIANLGNKPILQESEINGINIAIAGAVRAMTEAERLVGEFRNEEERKKLKDIGVRDDLMDSAIQDLSELVSNILNATSLNRIRSATDNLKSELIQVANKRNYQISVHTVGAYVDGFVNAQISGLRGWNVVRENIVKCVLSIYKVVNESNKQDARRTVRDLMNLEPDLFNDVLRGSKTLEYALRIQQNQQIKSSSQPMKPDVGAQSMDLKVGEQLSVLSGAKLEKNPDEVTTQERRAVEVKTGVGRADSAAQVVFDAKTEDEPRIEENRARLDKLLQDALKAIPDIDLRHGELTANQSTAVGVLLNFLGQLKHGHPDTDRVMEEYPGILAQLTALQKERVAGGQAKLYEGTRTR